jgi:hypothetical protein
VFAALATRRFPDDEEYRAETRADQITAALLAADPRVTVESDSVFASAGFRVTAWRPAPTPR